MKIFDEHSQARPALAAYICICVVLVLLLSLSLWGAYRDVSYLQTMLLESEISRLRSHAERTVNRLEQSLKSVDDLAKFAASDKHVWLKRHWAELIADEPERLYAAVVDTDSKAILHSVPDRSGQHLERNWYERITPEAGADVVCTKSNVLAGGQPAYNVRVPIMLRQRQVGDYHVGLNIGWFDRFLHAKRKSFLRQRGLVTGGILLIVLLATTSLFYIATHAARLREAISQFQLHHATEVAHLAAGLAHEIRNPMHAIRINLHALAKVDDQRRLKLSPEEHKKLLDESNREILRVEKLMQELVDFASPEESHDEVIDLKSEVQSTVAFIDREMLRNQINIHTDFPPRSAFVRFDPSRLRQLLLNLLKNSEQSFDGPGRIDISIRQLSDRIILKITDDGRGISDADRSKIFEPFFSTKANGSGLGLALVRRFITEANGEIACEDNSKQGTSFRISLPRALRTS